MENPFYDPFFENCWSPSPRSYTREVPVAPSPRRFTRNSPVNHHDNENRTTSAAPKVVSIPVHFIGLEKKRFNAALKIQKVFRGFLVRKSTKKILVIKREVDEIQRKLSENEMIGLICSNTKERLKMNEVLMRLLLRLDSIRGVDSGVRDARKSVIRKAIMLQDRVDKIAAGELMDDAGVHVSENAKEGAECEDRNDNSEDMEIDNAVDQCVEEVRNPVEASEGNSMAKSPDKSNVDGESPDKSNVDGESPEKSNMDGVKLSVEEENLVESIEEGWEEIPGNEEIKETVIEIQQPEMIQEHQKMVKEDDTRDMMAKMIEGNQKLTEMVAELCRSNAVQTQMINSLSQRVESLEKAYKKEKLRRKKKKMDKATTNAEN
ncbi:BAG family molecular chaperone regulator 6-like [Papaver somniferum]|uniref:BAG family molecular chaperone regulator 6-like n=1 Tax=Papaver somniferum TaxID=3469 RepID=UPI000E6FD34B|nr:BAG family molecular chaperone regulator 6-like [Papaver somniferum]